MGFAYLVYRAAYMEYTQLWSPLQPLSMFILWPIAFLFDLVRGIHKTIKNLKSS